MTKYIPSCYNMLTIRNNLFIKYVYVAALCYLIVSVLVLFFPHNPFSSITKPAPNAAIGRKFRPVWQTANRREERQRNDDPPNQSDHTKYKRTEYGYGKNEAYFADKNYILSTTDYKTSLLQMYKHYMDVLKVKSVKFNLTCIK